MHVFKGIVRPKTEISSHFPIPPLSISTLVTFPGVPDRAGVLQLETGSISPLWWNPPTVSFIYLCLYSNISNLLSKQRSVPLAEVASPQSALAARTQGAAVCCILTRLVHSHMNVVSTGRLCWIFWLQTLLFGLKLCDTMATCFALGCFRVCLFILFRLSPWLLWPSTGWIVFPTVKLQNSYMDDRVRRAFTEGWLGKNSVLRERFI